MVSERKLANARAKWDTFAGELLVWRVESFGRLTRYRGYNAAGDLVGLFDVLDGESRVRHD